MIKLTLPIVLAGALLSVPSGVAVGDDAAERAEGRQRFVLLSDGHGRDAVAAYGVLHAHGTSKVLGPRKDRFTFPDGKLLIRHKPTKGTTHESFDEVTCHFQFRERGTWKVVRGTGAYADAAGKGTYRVRGEGIACSENDPAETFYSAVRAKGHLSF